MSGNLMRRGEEAGRSLPNQVPVSFVGVKLSANPAGHRSVSGEIAAVHTLEKRTNIGGRLPLLEKIFAR